jgi:effector-binding domain-containing protein
MKAPAKRRVDEQTVIAMEHTGSYDEIGDVYRELYEWARRHDVKTTGRGMTFFLSPPSEFDPKSALYEVCLPVATAPQADSSVTVKTLPACTVAAIRVRGPYSKIPAHYSELLAWLSVEGWEVAGPPREVYIRRPAPDEVGAPEDYVTEIQFPIHE